MTKTPLIDLSRTIAFQRSYVTITGSINAALMLSQAVYWSPKTKDPDGWFYKSAEDWEEELGLTWEQQNLARKKLREADIWEEKREGVGAPLFYRINQENLESRLREMLNDHSGKAGDTSQGKPEQPVRESRNIYTETTTETTAETTTSSARQAAAGRNGHHDDKEGFKLEPETPTLEQQTWAAYSQEFRKRYRTDPVRNAKTNAQIKQLTKRLGNETPEVAAFYLHHNAQFYVQKCHAIGNLLADAEKLRTEWATGTRITNTRAQQADKSQSNQDLIAEARAHFGGKP
jgi:hypothetical protein